MSRDICRRQENPPVVDIQGQPTIFRAEEQLLKLFGINGRPAHVKHADKAPALPMKIIAFDRGRPELANKKAPMSSQHPHLIGREFDSPSLQENFAGIDRAHDFDPAIVPRGACQNRQCC